MPTNEQRFGTKNLTLNLPELYIAKLGRAAAAKMERSRTALAVKLMEAGAAVLDPDLYKELVAIRRQFYAACLLFVFALPLLAHDPRGLWRAHRANHQNVRVHLAAKTKRFWEPEAIEV